MSYLNLRKQPNGRSRLIDAKRFFAHHGLKVRQGRRVPDEKRASGIIGFQIQSTVGGERESESVEESTPRKRRKPS